MFLCTYTTLNSQDHIQPEPVVVPKGSVPQADAGAKKDTAAVPKPDVGGEVKKSLHAEDDKKPPDKGEIKKGENVKGKS